MKQMNIVHLVGSLDIRMGGLPRAVAGIASAQARSGHAVTLAAPGPLPEPEHLQELSAGPPLAECVTLRPLPVTRLPFPSPGLKRALEETPVDWLQVHGLWEPVLQASMRWARARGVPYGITPHSMLHPWHQQHHRWTKTLLRKGFGLDSLWASARRLQMLTASEAADWEAVDGASGRLQVIPNGISLDVDPGDSKQPVEALPDAPFLLFLGRLAKQKNPEALLDAFGRIAGDHPDLHLVLAGPDYGERDRLVHKAEAFGLEPRVHLPGQLTGQNKWDALHRCLLCCLPSRAEGFSLTLLEAALAGAPCLLSRECGFPELIHAGGGIEVSTDAGTLADQLHEALSDRSSLPVMGQRARELVIRRYTWAEAAEKMNRMIAEAL
jgi:glycosyltransferase involved in cell wall biosynthesis